jgi:hypothetical protein
MQGYKQFISQEMRTLCTDTLLNNAFTCAILVVVLGQCEVGSRFVQAEGSVEASARVVQAEGYRSNGVESSI